MGLVFSSKEFDLGNFVSKSVLQDDIFAWFAEEFVDVMPEFADITRSNGEISAFVDNRELVLTVIDLDSETGMKTPARSICKPYSNPAVQRINGVTNVAIWEICAYENDLMVDLPSKLINSCFAVALGLATWDEIETIKKYAFKVNEVLKEYFLQADIKLIDFKIEFGRYHGQIILADETSPDTCRLWDVHTNEKLDKDRFRRDLGNVEEAYNEVFKRLGL